MSENAATAKGKLAIYWAASCGGCEISILQIGAKILDVAAAFDVVLWPCATDGKVRDIEKMPDQSIDVCLFNGGIRTSEQEYMAQLMRRKSKVLVAFGSCASEGCIPGLANMNNRQEIFDTVYKEGSATTPENPKDTRPQHETKVAEGVLHLPVFYDTLKTLGQTVDVDYYLPGCPPEGDNIWAAIVAILEGKLPPRGATIGLNTTVCEECPRKRNEKKIKKFYRTWQIIPDEETCLLEQGLLCCGIATRAGCKALCPQVNSPCIGCHGPNDGVDDYGARLMSGLASVIDSNDPDEIDRIVQEGIPDPVGSFYRFSLASSLLRRKNMTAGNGAKK
jgi:F420-non-reducing hydrogenase small subunit